jgi:hypothetical protein
MTLKERCQAGEAKLEQISNALLDPRPEILDHCETELREVVGMLSESVDPSARPAVSDRSALLKLRNRTRLLALQVQNAVNLCHGWTQLGLSQGYTDQGRPALPPNEPLASYEV